MVDDKRWKIIDKAYTNLIDRDFYKKNKEKKKISNSLRANIENAYRKETGQYIVPWKAGFEVRKLDPTGASYEDAGDFVSAANSRRAQAKALTSRGNSNYFSAGVLYTASGDLDKAINAYKSFIEYFSPANPNHPITKEVKEKISLLEKKLESQNKRIERKRLAKMAIPIISVIGGFFFLSPNITGNAVGSAAKSDSNIMGILLFVIGIVAGYFYLKRDKRIS